MANKQCPKKTEAEKKLVASLLGKLFVSPNSSEEKLRETYNVVSEAVEEGLVTDTTGRNALYKIHVSLGKIVNGLEEQQQQLQQQQQRPSHSRTSRSVSVAVSEATGDRQSVAGSRAGDDDEEEEDDDEDDDEEEEEGQGARKPKIKVEDDSDGTVVPEHGGRRDSLVEDLLSDGEDTKMEDV